MTTQRAPFSPELQPIRDSLSRLLPRLEAKPEWYASIYFERKASRSFSANLKRTSIQDDVTQGVALRIYDGYTLHEQATDDLSETALERVASELVARVAESKPAPGATLRPYQAPSWAERLAGPLDAEITSQIPKGVRAETPAHFGIRFQEDPRELKASAHLERLKALIARIQALAPQVGLVTGDLSYVATRLLFGHEESIFIDRGANLSQSLFRLSLMAMTMSGAERSYARVGGLGGLEACRLTDEDLLTVLRDLKGLKDAARLEPGRYRVLFGPALAGVLAHEAFGHAQEADTCARGRSKAWELHKTGERVGNAHATILNNPAIFDNGVEPVAAWGSYFFDEEGWLASEQVLLDGGVLKSPMTNLTSAIRLGIPRTANGKRETWASGVYTRQTNTYFSAGKRTLPELLEQLGDGFVALHSAGGMEDPKGMGIQVGIQFLEEVKAGKRTGRIFKGPAGGDIQLTGYTPDILNSIIDKSKIEHDSSAPDRARHPYNDVGGCGKYHKEFVHAGCGGPYLLLENVTLG